MKEASWDRQLCCTQSCAKKHSNPMHSAATRQKLSDTLIKMGHKPLIQGGNGRGLTVPQQALLEFLGAGWTAEHVVGTGQTKGRGLGTAYKADLANPTTKTIIEVDGLSHNLLRVRALDHKRDTLLRSLGWRVFRVKNEQVQLLCETCKSPDILLTLLVGF
jgi:hypothetical protein